MGTSRQQPARERNLQWDSATRLKNAGEEAAGKVKETTGRATDNRRLEAEGKADQASANIKQSAERPRTPSRTPWTDPRAIANSRPHPADLGFRLDRHIRWTSPRPGRPRPSKLDRTEPWSALDLPLTALISHRPRRARYLAHHHAVRRIDVPAHPDPRAPEPSRASRPAGSRSDSRSFGGRSERDACRDDASFRRTCGVHPIVGQPTRFRSPRREATGEDRRRST